MRGGEEGFEVREVVCEVLLRDEKFADIRSEFALVDCFLVSTHSKPSDLK